jgi:hypothetical protein
VSLSPTARSQLRLRVEGYLVANTERWNPYAKVRQDLYGFIDTLAANETQLLAIQSTSGANHAARVLKVRDQLAKYPFLAKHFDIEIWSWSKRVVRNKDGRKSKRLKWTLRREKVGGE